MYLYVLSYVPVCLDVLKVVIAYCIYTDTILGCVVWQGDPGPNQKAVMTDDTEDLTCGLVSSKCFITISGATLQLF